MLSILVSLLSLHGAVLSSSKSERERGDAHASEKKYKKRVRSVSRREGSLEWGGCGKRITRKDREDTKQAKERDTEE